MSSTDYGSTSASFGLPQLAICALIGFLVLRWFFSSAPSSVTASSGVAGRTRQARRISPATVDMVQAMFPQVSTAAIRYELERNGGSVEATTEKILAEGTLQEPPASASTSVLPSRSSTSTARTPTSRGSPATTGRQPASSSTSKSTHTDLITRFNLQSRLAAMSSSSDFVTTDKGKAIQKNDRSSLMTRAKERRDLMIMQARKRMEEATAKEVS